MIQLTDQQQTVVRHRGGHLQVIACAGSGKTESISRRIAALIAEGVTPESIIAFTFTERAGAELKHRVSERVTETMGRNFLERLGPMFVGTIHSYCFYLLQKHVPKYANFDVLDEHRHTAILSREYQHLGLSKLGARHWKPIRDFIRTADIVSNEMIDVAQLEGPVADCYRAYLEMLDQFHFLSFGQIIAQALLALEQPDVYRQVHDSLTHLFVDEYQDINPAQERLIRLLAADPVKLCVVGDDDQSIYQWRGADVANILTFQDRYADVTSLPLDTNRRSRPSIIRSANGFALTIAPRLPKAMAASRPEAGVEVVAWRAETPEAESAGVADAIARLHADGFAYRDIAVLFRSVRTSAPPLVAELQRRGVPYRCGGRTGLFLQPEISLFGEVHAWFADGGWKDDRFGRPRPVELEALVAGLERHFNGGAPLPGLRTYLQDWKAVRLSPARPVKLVGDFYSFLNRLGAGQIDIETPLGAARFGALARFSQVLADFEHITRRGRYVTQGGQRVFRAGIDRGRPYAKRLHNYLVYYARDAYEEFEGAAHADLDAVDILTVHQAKGLEWPIVFLPSLTEGRFPSRRAGQPQEWLLPDAVFPQTTRVRYEGSEAEERRLFYVAMTRARDCLYLSHFDRMEKRFRPSRFFDDLGVTPIMAGPDLPRPAPDAERRSAGSRLLELGFWDVATYEDCGQAFQFRQAFGFQHELAVELGYGRAIHHVLHQLAELTRAAGHEPSAEDLQKLLDDEFYLPFVNEPSFQALKRAAGRLVSAYLGPHRDDLMRIWATERPFELHLPDGTMHGRADVILDHEGKGTRLTVVDYKTATDQRREEQYAMQLAMYAAAGRGEGLDIVNAFVHDLQTGIRKTVDISEDTVAEVVGRLSAGVSGIRAGRHEARPSPEKCSTCDYRRFCAYAASVPAAP